jgi:hypothetical protein
LTEVDRRRVVIAIKAELEEAATITAELAQAESTPAEIGLAEATAADLALAEATTKQRRRRPPKAPVHPEEIKTPEATPQQSEASKASPAQAIRDTDVESVVMRRAPALSEAIGMTHLTLTQILARA